MGRTPNRLPNYLRTEDITNWEMPTTYMIYKVNSMYVAVNGKTGIEEYRDSNFTDLFTDVLDGIPTGAGGGARVHIRAGAYYMDSQIITDNTIIGLVLTGDAATFDTEGTVIIANANMTSMIYNRIDFTFMEHIYWRGDDKADYCFEMGGTDNVTRHCSFATAKLANLRVRANNEWVDNCWFEVGYQTGLEQVETGDSIISNNIFYNNAYRDIQLVGAAASTTPRSIRILGNRFQTSDNGIWFYPKGGTEQDIIISHNIFRGIGQTASGAAIHDNAIYLAETCNHILIANNICNGDYGGTKYTNDFVEFAGGGSYTGCVLDNNIVSNINGSIVAGAANATQLVQNNSSTNVGIPGAAGQWATGGYEGLIVHDSNADKVYVYVDGAWEILN